MRFFFIAILLSAFNCDKKTDDPIALALLSENKKIQSVVENIEKHEVQILFTEVQRNSDSVSFKDYGFQVNDNIYFYPASTVKLPIAILALEKLNNEKKIDRNTLFSVAGDSVKTTFSKEIEKIFAVSDNAAYNRLFEYLGKDYINKKLFERGIKARISHRLSVPDSDVLITKSLSFFDQDSIILKTESKSNQPIKPLQLQKTTKGIGYMAGDSLVNRPMEFSLKNYLPLTSLHDLMKQFMFPELYLKEKQFQLTADDRKFLINTMKILPKEAGYPSKVYYDGYVKFLLYGDTRDSIPAHIKIFNKVGDAYGYLTDCAYIVNEKTRKEYIITATVHVNKNGIFNDDHYEYDTIGMPFLAELGRQLVK